MHRNHVLIIALVLMAASLLLSAIPYLQTGGKIAWATDLKTAQQQARTENKPLLISIHAPNCGWCRRMEAETFTDHEVVTASCRFVCVMLDSEQDAPTVRQFAVRAYPTTILLNASGNPILNHAGYLSPEQFRVVLTRMADWK